MKKILAVLLCAASVLTVSGCGSKEDVSGSSDADGSGAGTGTGNNKGKRPGGNAAEDENPEITYNADGSINWDSVPYADEADFETEEITYDADFGVNFQCVYITKYTGSSKVIKIPDEIDYKPVLNLGSYSTADTGVFVGLSDITVKTPEHFMSTENCFFNCSNVTLDISVPAPFKDYATEYDVNIYFGEYSFKDCKGVTVNMPEKGIYLINANAFSGCSDVDPISIPDDVKRVEKTAFDSGSIPKSITYRGNTYDASQYDEFIEAVDYYGSRPFDDGELGHSTLKIYDPYGIERYELAGVPRDTQGTYTVPDYISEIRDYAFTGCKSIENVVLHSALYVSEKAFDGYEGSVTFRGKTYAASEFNFEEALNEPFEQTLTDWDSVPYAPASDFEYEVLGMFMSKFVSIKKYIGTSKQVKIPETIDGVRVGSLFGNESYETVFDKMPDIEVLLPEDVALRDAFWACGGAKLYLPDTKIDINGAMRVLEGGVSVVYKGVIYDYEHMEAFYDAVNNGG